MKKLLKSTVECAACQRRRENLKVAALKVMRKIKPKGKR